MQRIIKFRGQRIDNNEWVYGCLCDYMRGSGKCIMPDSFFATRDFNETDKKGNPIIEDTMAIGGFIPVKPESVGQYTGLKDKNGVEIYEGDLLCDPPKDDWEKQNYSCFEVFFHNGDAHADYNIGFTMNRMHNHGSVCGGYIPSFKPKTVSKMEVIGNVFENPELLNNN